MLVCALLLAAEIPVSAADEAVSLQIKSEEITSLDSCVSIYLTSSSQVYGGSLIITYDPAVITYQDYSYSTTSMIQINPDYENGQIKVAFASTTAYRDMTLLNLYFTANTNHETLTEISFQDVSLYDKTAHSLTVTTKNAVCTVKPSVPITDIAFGQADVLIGIGDSLPLDLRILPSNAIIERMSWNSGNSRVASVDANGVVKGLAPGSATITCHVYDYQNKRHTVTCQVRVYQKPSVSVDSISASPGATITLPVRLDANQDSFYAGSFNISYDPTILKLISVEKSTLLSGALTTINTAYRDDAARVNFASQLPIKGKGILCYATFEVLQAGTATVAPTDVELFLEDSTAYAAIQNRGTVTADTATLSLSDVDGLASRGFSMILQYDGSIGFAGGGFTITYDSEKLTLGSVTALNPSLIMQINPTYGANRIRVSFAGTENVTSCELLEITFISKENCDMETSVLLENVSLYNQSGQSVSATLRGATVTQAYNDVVATEGDLSGDDVVDTRDATLLARYLADKDNNSFVFESADLNNDGWITDDDMVLLMRHLAEWETP